MSDSNPKNPVKPPIEPPVADPDVEDGQPFERRSAQAMVATYLQMTRYAELASMLHKARLRATEQRVARAESLPEVERLQRQLEAQQSQGETIELALDRFRRHAGDLRSFSAAGLTPEDFKILGIDELLGTEAGKDDSAGGEETH